MARITEKSLKSLRAPAAGNKRIYDDEVPGFGVRITANGVISFVLNYRVHGRERRYTIGRFPEYSATAARDEALTLRKQIREGKDPLEAKQQSYAEPLVSDLARDYLERYAQVHKRASSLRNDRQMLETIILPRLGNIRVQAAGRRDIEALHHSLKATPYRANRVLALLSKMFSLAAEWQWRTDNPAKGAPRYHEDKRQSWLNADQLEQFERALAAYPEPDAADALRLLILTGSREGEVLGAAWDQFDLDRGVWTKPSHHTKQKRIEHVPLSEGALIVLKRMEARKNGSPYLFPGRYGDKARVTLRRPWMQVCKAAGLATEVRIAGKRGELIRYKPTVRIHDLRHTFASHLVSKGESLHIVGKLLGHTQPQTTARYAHLSDEALRDATNRFGDILQTSKRRATRAR
jgi:integrase